MLMKLIIAGGRNFSDKRRVYKALKQVADKHGKDNMMVISGGATGADSLGELAAKALGIKVKRFPANWKKYGKSAGPKRNAQMANEGTHLIAFWDGKSRGTMNMINNAKKKGLSVYVGRY